METKELYKPFKSSAKNKKYSVYVRGDNNKTKLIHYGDSRYDHYKDTTPLKLYSNLNHNDKVRQKSYLARAKGIKDKQGNLTYKDKNTANYWAVKTLWSG